MAAHTTPQEANAMSITPRPATRIDTYEVWERDLEVQISYRRCGSEFGVTGISGTCKPDGQTVAEWSLREFGGLAIWTATMDLTPDSEIRINLMADLLWAVEGGLLPKEFGEFLRYHTCLV